MALEPVGVSLQAEGFKKYIKDLDEIEKKQREAFETEFKGTNKSYAQVTRAAKAYERELKQLAKAEEKAAREAEVLAQAEKDAAREMDEARQAAAAKAAAQPKAQIGAGFQKLRGGDIAGGAKGIAGGLASIGPAATIATGGLAAVAAGAAAAGAAIGVIGVGVLNVAKDTDAASKQIAASLGISAPEAAEKYNETLQAIFEDNPQAQFGEIAEAITLTERSLDGLSTTGLEQVAGDALKISQQFGKDLPQTIGATEQLIEQFGLSSQDATDLLTFGLQNIPAEDLIDSIGEYSNQFAQAGFTADEFFSILATGTAGGVLGTDKIADATKEFQIRFLEGNESLKNSFATLGLDFDQFTAQVNSGQASIADVFGAVVDRAGEVDLSVASNRAAIAGLGTQFEDLGAAAIAALDPDAIGFEDTAGAAETLNERFNNLRDAFTSIARGALGALKPIGQTVLELANSIVPKIKAAFEAVRPAIEAFAARIVPAFQFAGEALGRLGKAIGGASSGVETFEKVLNAVAFVIEGVAGGIEILARVVTTFKQVLAFAKAGAAAFGELINQVFISAIENAKAFGSIISKVLTGQFKEAFAEAKDFEFATPDFSAIGDAAIDAFLPVTEAAEETAGAIEEIGDKAQTGLDIDTGALVEPFEAQTDAIELTIEELEAYEAAIKQAEDLQRSWAREAEDAAIKVARANEDAARKQEQAVADLQGKQAGDRDKLLKNQSKKLDEFERDRRSQIKKAENDIRRARQEAAEQRKRDQQKLQRELAQAQEKFNLSQLQSERRFKLQESRLIAEGDVLGLKQLREDQALQRQEEKENFDQSQKERVKSAAETEKGQAQDLERQLADLKANLEDKRAELLRSFDQEIADQAAAQAEERQQQQQKFQRDEQDRAIALQREEEDRRLSQARQLEDLGRSWAEQGVITEEGAAAIAGELEKVFGIDGTADEIMAGFADKTKDDFTSMIDDIQAAIANIKPPRIEPPKIPEPEMEDGPSNLPPVIPDRAGGRIPRFQEGGIVPGSPGSPQLIVAHAGETIIPAGQQRSSFTMAAPVVPSQSLEVNMSGGFNVSGDGQGDEKILRAAAVEMTENFRIAVQRLARRN